MEKNIASIIQQLIATIWRQRTLLFAPVLIMLPLTILGTKILPKNYVASALLAIPESDRDNPFKTNKGLDYSLSKRVEGLESWLKSDHIMSTIQRQFTRLDPQNEPVAFAQEVSDLRDALTLTLVGNDFLRFSLVGKNPKGLGNKLEAIITRCLEGLLIPDRSVKSASQFILDHQRDRLEAIKKERQQLANDYKALLSQAETEPLNIKPASFRKALPQNPAPSERPNDEMDKRLQSAYGKRTKLLELEQKMRALDEQQRQVERTLKQSTHLLDSATIQNPLGILNAPEGIKMIDAPKDPLKATTSNLKIILIGLIGALFMGISLATLRELADPRLRTPEQIKAISGTRIIGHLPPLETKETTGFPSTSC